MKSEYNFLYDYSTMDNIIENLQGSNFSILDESLFPNQIDRHIGFDPTAHVDSEGYYIRGKLYEHEKINPGPDFTYRMNRQGFRTNHLSKLTDDTFNVFFSGCSFTHGCGLPAELAWTSYFVDSIKTNTVINKPVNSINLALGGSNVSQIYQNLRVFIAKYGKPDLVCLLIPGIERVTRYSTDYESYLKITTATPDSDNYLHHKVVRDFMKSYVIEDLILEGVQTMHDVEFMCKMLGIELIWSTHEPSYLKLFDKIDFSNYIKLPDRTLGSFGENTENLPYWEMARDGNHLGTGYHKVVAKHFTNAFLEGVNK